MGPSGISTGQNSVIPSISTASPPYPISNISSIPWDTTTCTEEAPPPPVTTPCNTTDTVSGTIASATGTGEVGGPTNISNSTQSCNETTFVTRISSRVSSASSSTLPWLFNTTSSTRPGAGISTGTGIGVASPSLTTLLTETLSTVHSGGGSLTLLSSSSSTGYTTTAPTFNPIDSGEGPLDHHHNHSDLPLTD
ncbi:hypothetical protein B0T17DRAFT_658916 [Bombardia bombarda]|uniref:Uncharacterized protein n=1 Tax=Bombardia bombarda TaxID=252184 RepID=A0AA39U0V0_9PEZI|nr:hypothetical protein B0T17DRAFT_658916 [Bombardia bombarda]